MKAEHKEKAIQAYKAMKFDGTWFAYIRENGEVSLLNQTVWPDTEYLTIVDGEAGRAFRTGSQTDCIGAGFRECFSFKFSPKPKKAFF